VIWLERKYISLLSSRLDRFKQKTPLLFNFRCPFCKDSKKNKNKARGYLMQKKGKFWFYCHNCSHSSRFDRFLKAIDQTLYEQYLYEGLQEDQDDHSKEPMYDTQKKQKPPESPFEGLQTVSRLPADHYARKYLFARKIPLKFWSGLYYCPEFKKFVNGLVPGKFKNTKYDEARILIPLMTNGGTIIGFQGRALGICLPRYITIILEEDMARLYGLDTVNLNNKFYLTEGPFDSMFLENAMAVCGSDLVSALHKIDANKDLAVAVFDNEPRNKEIVAKMKKAVKDGWKVCFWPPHFDFKDINEAVFHGLNSSEIMHIIDKHTFQGLEAEMALVDWKK